MKKRTVLFVDDEENFLNAVKRVLMDEPFETLFATNSKQAMEILQNQEIHVIVADIRMPGISGLELLEKVKCEFPHVIRLILSGDAQSETVLEAINKGEVFRYIPKPCKMEKELKAIIRQAIDYYHLHSERAMLMSYLEQLINGEKLDDINLQLIRTLITERNKNLYKWSEACTSTANR